MKADMKLGERIIVDDFSYFDSATVKLLLPHVGLIRVGLEMLHLITINSLQFRFTWIEWVYHMSKEIGGGRIFFDLDINHLPDTMANIVAGYASLNPAMISVNESAGESLKSAVAHSGNSRIFGVSSLANISGEAYKHRFGSDKNVHIFQFAQDMMNAGVDGIKCSCSEAISLRSDNRYDNLQIACTVDNMDDLHVAASMNVNYFIAGRDICGNIVKDQGIDRDAVSLNDKQPDGEFVIHAFVE